MAVLLLTLAAYGLIGPSDRGFLAAARTEAAEPSGAKPSGEKRSALPPLKVDRNAPLLLDSPPSGAKRAGAKPSALPPLKVDRGAPLLLDSPPSEAKSSGKKKPVTGPVADNMACHVCHTTYEEESLAVVHAKANVGCVKCHGPSIAHRNDEDNITPPDIMFAADQIDAACVKCHETHDAPAKKVLATWHKRCPAKENPDQLVCTDCHGEHRMRFRSIWWDKKTRKLANRQGEGVKYAPDYTKKPGAPPAKTPSQSKADSKP